MYHYVRELKKTKYPNIKGLELKLFKNQLLFLKKHYNFIRLEDCLEAIGGGKSLPKNSVLLTFDDGYIDHYVNVLPLLESLEIQGFFFPPVCAIEERRVLDVNKIHFLLASTKEYKILIEDIFHLLNIIRSEGRDIISNEDLYFKLAIACDWDSPEVMFIKNLLQKELSVHLRSRIINELFMKYVTKDEKSFADQLYMNKSQLKSMIKNGMIIGAHGYEHVWMDAMTKEEQSNDLNKCILFLNGLGLSNDYLTISYPFGGYNRSLLNQCENLNFRLGFTVDYGIAQINEKTRMILKRIDTNHLPNKKEAEPNDLKRPVTKF